MKRHDVRFFRSRYEPKLYHAACSCGWTIEGDEDHVRGRAATHDLDEEAEKGIVREPPLRRPGFVSGLPARDRK